MTLLRSWLHSLTLFLPRRLFPLVGAVVQSLGTIYQYLWPYLLACTAISATGPLMNVAHSSAPTQLTFNLVNGLLGTLLQIIILSALLHPTHERNFRCYMGHIRSHWLVLLLPFMVVLLAMPIVFVGVMIAFLFIGIFGGLKQYTSAPESCTELGCPLPASVDPAAVKLQSTTAVNNILATMSPSIKAATYTAATTGFVLAACMQFAAIFYLEDTPGFGKLMRALGKSLGLLFRNLPFFTLFFAMQVIPLIGSGMFQRIVTFSLTSPVFRLASAFATPLLFTPLAIALNLQIYRALRQ